MFNAIIQVQPQNIVERRKVAQQPQKLWSRRRTRTNALLAPTQCYLKATKLQITSLTKSKRDLSDLFVCLPHIAFYIRINEVLKAFKTNTARSNI